MTAEEAELVQRTWRTVLPVGDTFAELFYGRLFAREAALRALFRGEAREQGRSLIAMLSVVAANAARPERISLALSQLGARHAAYGVEPQHFELFEDALLFALEHALIDVFSAEVKAAWRAAFRLMAEAMLPPVTAGSRPGRGPAPHAP